MNLRAPLMAVVVTMVSCKPSAEKFGDEVVLMIETFQAKHGRLPDDLAELGVVEKEEGPVYYQKKGDDEFILYYGATLGESVIYDPETRKWK